MVAAGVVAGGLAVHAIAANVAKRKELSSEISKGKQNEKNLES
jgi:hydrogenase small subunit